MAAIATVLKIVVLMAITWFTSTQCQDIQSQDYVLSWNITNRYDAPVHFNFTTENFRRFFSCLCKSNTESCSAGTVEDDFESQELESNEADTDSKIYLCRLKFNNHHYWIISCVKTQKNQSVTTSSCWSYFSNMPLDDCRVDKVDIAWNFGYTTKVIYNNESVVQVQNCQADITHKSESSETPPTSLPLSFLSSLTSPPSYQSTSFVVASTNAVNLPTLSASNVEQMSMTTTQPTAITLTFLPSSLFPSIITSNWSVILTTVTSANDASLTEEEDTNNNLVTIILGVSLGVVVIIAIAIIIGVTFWRRRKMNPTSTSAGRNHQGRREDFESPYEMSDVGDNPTENSNSQTPVTVPGPTSYLYATVDLEEKHRNRKGKNSKKKPKGDHGYNNKKALTNSGKKGQAKSGNAAGHVADYYNLDPQLNENEYPKDAVYANDGKAIVGSSENNVDDNVDDYNIVNMTSTNADANATNNSNGSSSNNYNTNNVDENSTDDDKNRYGHADQPQGSNLKTVETRVNEQDSIVNDSQSQDSGAEYSGLHETQRHFQNPYNVLPDQVPVSTTTTAAQPTTKAPTSSSFDVAAGTSTYSLATPISK